MLPLKSNRLTQKTICLSKSILIFPPHFGHFLNPLALKANSLILSNGMRKKTSSSYPQDLHLSAYAFPILITIYSFLWGEAFRQ